MAPAAPPSRWTVPEGACDVHCHLYGPKDRFPYQPGDTYVPPHAPLELYRAMAQALGLSRAVFVQPAVYGTDHAAILDALRLGDGAYAGVAILDAQVSDAELARLDEAGFRGARFNYLGHLGARPSRDAVLRLRERVGPLGWHLVFHLGAEALREEAGFLADLGVPVVIDHMARLDAAQGVAQPGFAALLDLVRLPHVWVKISAADRMTTADTLDAAAPFMAALVEAAPDRIVWGTDWPHPNAAWPPDEAALLALLARAVPDVERRDAVLVANPARLYGFGR